MEGWVGKVTVHVYKIRYSLFFAFFLFLFYFILFFLAAATNIVTLPPVPVHAPRSPQAASMSVGDGDDEATCLISARIEGS